MARRFDARALEVGSLGHQENYQIEVSLRQLPTGQLKKLDSLDKALLAKLIKQLAEVSRSSWGKEIKSKRLRTYQQYPANSDLSKFPKPGQDQVPRDARWGRIKVSNQFRLPCHFVVEPERATITAYIIFIDPRHEWCPTE